MRGGTALFVLVWCYPLGVAPDHRTRWPLPYWFQGQAAPC